MASPYEMDLDRTNRNKLLLAVLGAAISIGTFMLFGLGLVPMEKGDFMPMLVVGLFLLAWLVKVYLQDELPWHRRFAVVCGGLYVVALILVFLRDLNLPVTQ